ncbi:AraC family transcriptional regulator (plasmid) [Tistrella bauzanensis]|uniref:AraC family transcriptional regulator n=1 Tax=Tistrella TaxID=171436 RepID=UPI0031F66B33
MEIIEAAGLEIFLYRTTIHQGACWTSTVAPGLWLGTLAQGSVAIDRQPAAWAPGMAARFWSADPFPSHHTATGDGMVAGVFLRVKPDALADLLGPEVERLTAGRPDGPQSDGTHVVDLPMALIWRMLGTSGPPASRRLHLTAMALHLLGLALDTIGDADTVAPSARLSAGDIERLHAARDILLGNLAAPPDVPMLARMVGLNTRKLGQGFRLLFGSPVYAFVKSRRLEEARRLIEDEGLGVAQAAWRVGYSPAHLSTAFRRHHGVVPTALRQQI